VVRKGSDAVQEVIEIKPDKMPVGRHDRQDISFALHHIDLIEGDVVFSLTDGFPDQFGGERGKKYLTKNLREMLVANADLSMTDMHALLEKSFEEWKGDLEQVDDICVIGVRV
jgi:serine phosphatase RsbU (regulator of sigma subunit)